MPSGTKPRKKNNASIIRTCFSMINKTGYENGIISKFQDFKKRTTQRIKADAKSGEVC